MEKNEERRSCGSRYERLCRGRSSAGSQAFEPRRRNRDRAETSWGIEINQRNHVAASAGLTATRRDCGRRAGEKKSTTHGLVRRLRSWGTTVAIIGTSDRQFASSIAIFELNSCLIETISKIDESAALNAVITKC